MKENVAPQKIYITNYDIEPLPKNEQLSERWHEVSTKDTDIEYTRTDAFIEKATEWLRKNADNYTWYDESEGESGMVDGFIEVFKNYMKGE